MFKQAFVLILGVLAVGLTASQASGAFSPPVDGRAARPAQATSATYYQTYLWRDFQPFQSSVNVSFTGNNADRRLYIVSGGGEVTTRLQLPQGAQVTEVTYYYFDNTPAPQDLGMSITCESLATGQTAAFGGTAPTVTSTSMMSATFTISPALIIDNSQFSCEIYAGFYAGTPNLGFRGARIGYMVPTVWLPLINRQ